MNDPKRIQFPGLKNSPEQQKLAQAVAQVAGTGQRPNPSSLGVDVAKAPDESKTGVIGPDGKPIPLNEDQAKAIGLILGGLPFVFVAFKPTATGCDFFSACNGQPQDLTDHYLELPGMIEALYKRKGLL